MALEPVADDVFQIALPPLRFVNAYLAGDVLVDAGLGAHGKAVLDAVKAREVASHVLTHAHGDHAGGSRRVVDELGVQLACGAADRAAVEAGKPVAASPLHSLFRWKGVNVTRELHEGDEVGPGFTVLDVPGHSPGHIALWRESDRTLICGDVVLDMNIFTMRAGLNQPPGLLTPDPARNRESARRLAQLSPRLVLFGHGEPLRDPDGLRAFTDTLP